MEIHDKDIYEYIVNLADDRDVINMLAVNRKFNDDSYFKKILEKRYPLLLRFKIDNETYKQFYLKMVKYMALLWEKYQIPYIPGKDFNPKYFYEKFGKNRIYTIALYEAAEIGDIKLAQYLMDKGARVDEFTYISVGVGGSVEMMKFLLQKYSPPNYKYLQSTLRYAKENNQQSLIDFLVESGVKI